MLILPRAREDGCSSVIASLSQHLNWALRTPRVAVAAPLLVQWLQMDAHWHICFRAVSGWHRVLSVAHSGYLASCALSESLLGDVVLPELEAGSCSTPAISQLLPISSLDL